MWRNWLTHQFKETRFLAEVTAAVFADQQINRLVSEVLERIRTDKKMPRFSSWPTEKLFSSLGFLYAVVDGKVHLSEIEELRREKIFLGEVEEAEEIMKEKVASLEVFLLTSSFDCSEKENSRPCSIVKTEKRAVLQRLAEVFRLSADESEDVFHLILLYERVTAGFSQAPARSLFEYLVRACQKYGRDADDFLDLLLAAVFLAAVIGENRGPQMFFNFLSAERTFSLERSAARRQRQAEKGRRAEQARLRQAGLDGTALMTLFKMKPGPEFGQCLAAIQAFARGEGELSGVPEVLRGEIISRIIKFKSL
jgi:hypothetical protein